MNKFRNFLSKINLAPSIKKLASALLASLLLLGVFQGAQHIPHLLNPSSQEDFPTLERNKKYEHESGSHDKSVFIEDFGLIMPYAVIGTVRESNLGLRQSQYILNPKTTLKVEQVLKGKVKEKEINIWVNQNSYNLGPNLKTGDRVLVFLYDKHGKENGNYNAIEYSGYFYIADDDRVYPARITEALKPVSGMKLSEVKRRIRYGTNMKYALFPRDEESDARLKKLYPDVEFDFKSFYNYDEFYNE